MRRLAVGALLVAMSAGCGDATGPLLENLAVTSNVSEARAWWLNSKPGTYEFEYSTDTEWFPRSGYYRVRVENDEIVEMRDPSGKLLTQTGRDTMEDHWSRILAADAEGTLRIVTFSASGVPVEYRIDDDGTADDMLHVWIRSFAAQR